MAYRAQITRDICIAGLDEVYRSSATALAAKTCTPVSTIPLRRDALYRFDGDEVLLTTRYGQSFVGRLRVTERSIELLRLVARIPCRHRLALEDIAACCMYGPEDAFWDAPTRPQCPAALHAGNRDDERDGLGRSSQVDDPSSAGEVGRIGGVICASIIQRVKSSSDPQLTILD